MGLQPITKYIVLDISKNKYVSVPVNQYDKNIQNIVVTITDYGKPYLVDSTIVPRIKGKKADDNNVLNNCTVLEDGRINIEIRPQMTVAYGLGVYELVLFDATNNKVLHTMDFILNVKKGVFQNDEEIISTDDFSALEEALLKVDGLDAETVKQTIATMEQSLSEHLEDTNNPHTVTKSQVGLGNVDNTSDVNKPISLATQTALNNKVDKTTTINGKALSSNITLSASDVSADAGGTAESKVSTHNTSTTAHSDIRDLITNLTNKLNTLADSDDETLDQLSEIVAYIKSNKELIDAITTSKINVSDIIDNLTTNVATKPLSAAQGVVIKGLIDSLQTEVDKKVDKVSGKGLSTNDYTTEEQTKLSGIATGAEVNQNAFSNVKVGSTTIAADSKTDTLELVAGNNITITTDEDGDKITISSTGGGTGTVGSLTDLGVTATATELNYMDGVTSNVQTQLNNKVSVVSGKGLSTNDYTTTEKNKLADIEDGANKTVVDSALSSTSTNPVQNKVVNSALAGKSNSSHTHNYAGSSSAGGVATSAAKLSNTTVIGSATQPVYFNANGVPVACELTKDSVGLENVDNTSDADKPISNATQTVLDGKAPMHHANSTIAYGAGTSAMYGHVKLSDAYTSSGGNADSSTGASSMALYNAWNNLNTNKTRTIYGYCQAYNQGVVGTAVFPNITRGIFVCAQTAGDVTTGYKAVYAVYNSTILLCIYKNTSAENYVNASLSDGTLTFSSGASGYYIVGIGI